MSRYPNLSKTEQLIPWARQLTTQLERDFGGSGTTSGGTGSEPLVSAQTPEKFGAAGNGIADDTSAVQAAFNAAGDGGRVRLDGTYLITASIDHAGGITVDGSGEILVGDDLAVAALNIEVATLATLTVTAIDNAETFVFSGDQGTLTDCARITVSAANANLVAGAVAKIVSADQLTGVETGKQRGEFVYIGATEASGAEALTSARLEDVYTTTPELVILDASKTVRISGIRFRTTSFATAIADEWAFAYIRILGAVAPLVESVTFVDGTDIGCQFQGCLGHKTQGLVVRRMLNRIDTFSAGYGVQDGGCSYGQHNGNYYEDCRHGFTTVAHTAATNPKVSWGRNRGTVVSSSVAFACSAGAFDTHSDADGVLFLGCTADAGYQGRTSSYSGYQFRGQRVRGVGCIARGHKFGFVFFKQEAGEGTGHELMGCAYDGVGSPFRQFSNNGDISGRLTDFSYRTTNPIGIRLQGVMRVQGGFFDYIGSDNAGHTFELDDDADAVDLVAEGFLARFAGGTGTNCRVVAFQGDGIHKVRLRGEVQVGANTWQGIISTSSTAKAIDVEFFMDADAAPSNPNGQFNLSSGSTIAATLNVKRARTSTSARIARNSLTANHALDIDNQLAPVIVYDCGVTTGAGIAITSSTGGEFIGQLLYIKNRAASVGTLTVNATAPMALVANRVLAAGEGMVVVWDGSEWGETFG